MKSFKLLTIILFLLIPLSVFSQTVSATFFNLPQQKVYLNAYTGFYYEIIDSVMMSQDKRVEFNTPMKKGMYALETEYGNNVEFLYDDAPIKIVVRDIYEENTIGFIDSQTNNDWKQYQNMKEQTLNSLNLLKPILRDYDKKSEFYIKSLNEYQQLQDEFISFTDSLILHENYASTLIRVDRFPSINLNDDFKKQRNDLIANFFNDVDFNDSSLIPTDVLSNKIFDFLSIQQPAGQSRDQQLMTYILAVDNVLYRASVNYDVYKYVFQFIMELFNDLGVNEVVDYMTRMPYLEEMNCAESQYDELQSIVEFNSRVKIGGLAENISGKTIFDKDFSLYDIENDFIIVYFWSYSCEHCRENIKDLKIFLEKNHNFSLVAVTVKGDLKKVRNLVKKEKIVGYFYHDGLEWNSPCVDDYAVSATPSFFLLDKDKRILYKPFDFKELNEFVNLIIKQ